MEKIRLLFFLLLVIYTSSDHPEPKYLSEYIYVENTLSWFDAKDYCSTKYDDLFKVLIGNELNDLSGSANERSWIGLNRWTVRWVWADGSAALYVNWFRSQNCAAVTREGVWLDLPCHEVHQFACEKSPGIWKFGQPMSWIEAKHYCESNSMGFAVIRHASDNSNITGMLPDSPVWIGLSKDFNNPMSDAWKWVNNQPLTFGNWFTALFCAVMDRRGFWFDRLCFEEHRFVCFGEPNNVPQFSLVNERKTWRDAQSHCETLNMKLLMARTPEENTAVLGNISHFFQDVEDHLWIGLYNDPWFWSNWGLTNVQKWNSKQPDGNDLWNNPFTSNIQTCVASMSGEWYDENCSLPLPFFCSATVRSMILVSEPKSWEEALEHCRDRYVDLVSLTSDAEQQVAVRKTEDVKSSYVWTGLRFLVGSWFWVYGDSLQYENWVDGGPEQCPVTRRCGALAVGTGKWEARLCNENLNFLCFQNE